METITVGIVGSRRRNSPSDYRACCLKLMDWCKENPGKNTRLVSGGCPTGGDKFAEEIARRYGLTITIHHADWDGPHGKCAGFVRNSQIAEDCDVLIALPAEDRTGGTEDTIKKAAKLGKRIILV